MSEPRVLTTAWIVGEGAGARILKSASASQQLGEDPFGYSSDGGQSGLVHPPYDLDQLSRMLETNTLHARACKQKASDVAGRGFSLRPLDPEATTNDAASTTWAAFLASVEEDERGDEAFHERVGAAAQDYESVGWGVLEVSRNAQGVPDGLWHVPAHTVRAHLDNRRFCQLRGTKTVWFKRFGLAGDVERDRGGWTTGKLSANVRGNELIVVRNYTPRSSYYGLPDHIPALAAMAGWRAQAEFNVRFFDNNAVPSYAVIIEGADISPALEEKILLHFRQIKGDPHRTLIIPVPGSSGDEAPEVRVRFEKLASDVKDASFRLYKQDNALEICIAHGIPPYRVGWPIVGSLGGSTAEEMTQIYNDSIVQPRQEIWEQRLTRSLLGAKGLALTGQTLKAAELDVRNETRDVAKATALWGMNAANVDWITNFFGLPQRKGMGGMYADEFAGAMPAFGAIPAPLIAKRWSSEVSAIADLRKRVAQILDGIEERAA